MRRVAYITSVLSGLALLSLLPFVLFGYAGQAFVFQFGSWLDIHQAWRSGHLALGWAKLAQFGLGDAHLIVYPPVSLLAGALLSFLLPFRLLPGAFMGAALVGNGLSMYYASRRYLAGRDRLAAAILYMLNPYLLFNSLIRFETAELTAMILLPLLLDSFVESVWLRKNRAVLLLGCLLGLGCYIDIPFIVGVGYVFGLSACVVCFTQRSGRPLMNCLISSANRHRSVCLSARACMVREKMDKCGRPAV